jgi:uncharacterized repeat protein (TIGR01451 family)
VPADQARPRADATISGPRLKVEVSASPGRPLKGLQVSFTIAVYNSGTGQARNLIVQAKLSNGLRLNKGDIVEQTIAGIKPGERVELDPLIVDTIAGGQQSCTVEARSPDVNAVVEDQRVIRNIEVIEPELTVKLTGQKGRHTGQVIDYKLSVTNPGTAPARKVKLATALPSAGGKLFALPDRTSFDKESRKLFWALDQLEPGQTVDLRFMYLTTNPGLYRATAEATSGELRSSDTMATDVSGIAVLDLQVTQTLRVIDVGKTNFLDITIKNVGSKEALRLQLRGKLTRDKLKVLRHFNVEKGQFQYDVETGDFVFPEIDRLAAGQTITLSLEVQGVERGLGDCRFSLAPVEMGDGVDRVEEMISTTIGGGGGPNRPK